jgi:hypothetical protein
MSVALQLTICLLSLNHKSVKNEYQTGPGTFAEDTPRPARTSSPAVLDAILATGGTVEEVYIEDAVHGQQGPWRYGA